MAFGTDPFGNGPFGSSADETEGGPVVPVEQSILKGVKKTLGLDENYHAFDHDVMDAINTSFFTLNQLGLGPAEGFMVEDDTAKWNDFTGGRINLNAVKSYIYLRARLLFDPPGTPHHIKALEDQKLELEYRLKLDREVSAWGLNTGLPDVDPLAPDLILDGGTD